MLPYQTILRAALLFCCLTTAGLTRLSLPPAALATCMTEGWDPAAFQLKDHSIFQYQGMYYLISIRFTQIGVEDEFAYARSADLCEWEDLGSVLDYQHRLAGLWDSNGVWAPFVIEEQGIYYLFYTGVGEGITQSIMLATTTDPADPQSWQAQGMIFQPDHTGMVWPGLGQWSDARDPMIIKVDGRYYLYYTGKDEAGGIIGVATATDIRGPWQDYGATLTLPYTVPESPSIVKYGNSYYLSYSRSNGLTAEVRVGPSPGGPWIAPRSLAHGFAHEFWISRDGDWMTSYVRNYAVVIKPVYWTDAATPMPIIVSDNFGEISPVYLPVLVSGAGTH